ncbi:MAG: acetyl-CoA carboxylase biotin carboxyl carrier protein subunit, partial [Oligoflexus sp.]
RELAISVPGLGGRTQAAGAQGESLRSPMVGKVLKVQVSEGQIVERGQELLVIEAMKMENKLFAKNGGRIAELHVAPGQQVGVGQLLALIKAE